MKLQKLNPKNLQWNYDFSPRRNWPRSLPVIAARVNASDLAVVAGFDRRHAEGSPSVGEIDVLVVEDDPVTALKQLWPSHELGACELQRFHFVLGCVLEAPLPAPFVLEWPIEIQNFFDSKQVSLKALKPLQYLSDWKTEIVKAFLELAPTSSQIREIADLLCDLKLGGRPWVDCAPGEMSHVSNTQRFDSSAWITKLKRSRFPRTLKTDDDAANLVKAVSWPRGVQARWERQGDQAGIVIQTKVNNPVEWKRFKENLEKLELGDGFWKI
jgi:hypothetical protein